MDNDQTVVIECSRAYLEAMLNNIPSYGTLDGLYTLQDIPNIRDVVNNFLDFLFDHVRIADAGGPGITDEQILEKWFNLVNNNDV
jgi:hypothetical protein